ncbi:hypothetical protein MLD38_019240 [Melastoma candidum]|uniref:Uncharacterized protein n=1 Tax=Melastoma candidum TaxID=119954 RepID=A0ACB9QZU9_9MYRT|nr:hypothetical protein MLD38_019240 [Melastoma candidum]
MLPTCCPAERLQREPMGRLDAVHCRSRELKKKRGGALKTQICVREYGGRGCASYDELPLLLGSGRFVEGTPGTGCSCGFRKNPKKAGQGCYCTALGAGNLGAPEGTRRRRICGDRGVGLTRETPGKVAVMGNGWEAVVARLKPTDAREAGGGRLRVAVGSSGDLLACWGGVTAGGDARGSKEEDLSLDSKPPGEVSLLLLMERRRRGKPLVCGHRRAEMRRLEASGGVDGNFGCSHRNAGDGLPLLESTGRRRVRFCLAAQVAGWDVVERLGVQGYDVEGVVVIELVVGVLLSFSAEGEDWSWLDHERSLSSSMKLMKLRPALEVSVLAATSSEAGASYDRRYAIFLLLLSFGLLQGGFHFAGHPYLG